MGVELFCSAIVHGMAELMRGDASHPRTDWFPEWYSATTVPSGSGSTEGLLFTPRLKRQLPGLEMTIWQSPIFGNEWTRLPNWRPATPIPPGHTPSN